MAVSDYDAIIDEAAREWDVDPHWARAVMQQESGGTAVDAQGRPVTSKRGAVGLMQIMPDTAKGLGVADTADPVQNIWGGVKYLAQLRDQFGGDLSLATAAYNAGPEAVNAFVKNKTPLPKETSANYLPNVVANYQRFAGNPQPARASPEAKPAPDVPSDDDFLKSVGAVKGGPSPAQATPDVPSDEDFLKSVGAKLPPPPPEPYNPDADPTIAAQVGMGDPNSPAVAATNRVFEAGLHGAVEGAKEGTHSLITPYGETVVSRIDPYTLGAGSALINPALKLAGGAMGAIGGASASLVGQTADELGVPALGRDINMMAQVAPAAHMGLPVYRMPGANPLLAERTAASVSGANPLTAGEGAAEPGMLLAQDFRAAPGNLSPQFKPAVAGASEPIQATSAREAAATSEPPPQGASPQPQSVGAAASREGTPAHLIGMTPDEISAYQATAEGQKLIEAQQPGIRDTNSYVPGVLANTAEQEQTVNSARELKALGITAPEVSQAAKDIAFDNSEARKNFFAGLARSKRDVDVAQTALDAQADKALKAIWANKTDADAQPVLDLAAEIKKSPDGRRPLVRSKMDSVTNELKDDNGNLITDPEQLYGVRKHIDDLLSKEAAADDPLSTRATANLLALKAKLDEVIEQAAPGFADYRNNYAQAAQKIDVMRLLQGYEPKLLDSRNYMTYNKFQAMMRSIVDGRQSGGIDPAQYIPDETMQKLWAMRDDLRRSASAQELARAPGSDTAQNTFDVIKNAAGGMAGETAIHAGAHLLFGPFGNAAASIGRNVLGSVLSARTARRQTTRGMEMLHPPQGRNPLSDAP